MRTKIGLFCFIGIVIFTIFWMFANHIKYKKPTPIVRDVEPAPSGVIKLTRWNKTIDLGIWTKVEKSYLSGYPPSIKGQKIR